MAKTYEERMQDLRSGLPQGGTKSGKAPTSESPATDTELVTSKIAATQRRADDRAAAEAAGVLGPLRPPKTKMPKSTYKGKTPADAVPRFIESLLGEEDQERSRAEDASQHTWGPEDPEWDDVLESVIDPADPRFMSRIKLMERWMRETANRRPKGFKYSVNEQGLELSSDVNVNYDDPQAIADAADDHAAQHIYKDIPGEDVPDAAAIDYEREQGNPNRTTTYTGDGPGGEGTVYFYEMSGEGGGGQRSYWVRDDGSVVNVTNILFPPSAQ